MVKKIIAWLLVIATTATIAVGGTLAYLTDRESEANVFTTGDVKIDLKEDFTDGAQLLPGVEIVKKPTIVNEGPNDAWVWATVAVPGDLVNVIEFLGKDETSWTWKDTKDVTIDGKAFKQYTVLYNASMTKDEETAALFEKVALDKSVDIDPDGQWHNVVGGTATDLGWNNSDGNPIIYVNAYAIQTEPFDTVQAAYEAYQAQWGDNGVEYPKTVSVAGSDKAALEAAINEASAGDTVKLSQDTTIAGYAAAAKLVIDKAVTLDLNGHTLTTESGWGGIDAKGGCSIINGTINHTGNTAAIKAFQVETISNVTINVTETAGKTKGGIVVQNGDSYVGSINNVTINGATNGIECYRSTGNPAIGSMSNVTIDATDNGIFLNGAGVLGAISDCNIHGGNIGINAYLANVWSINLDLENCKVSGGASGIDVWDEAAVNTGASVTLNHTGTTFTGGTNDIKITLGEEIKCVYQGVEQTAPVSIYEKN